ESVDNESAKEHRRRNVAWQLRLQMGRKCGKQDYPPNTHRRQEKCRQQERIRRPKNRNRMGSKSQRESNFCSQIISNKHAQRDAADAPIKKLSVTSLCP